MDEPHKAGRTYTPEVAGVNLAKEVKRRSVWSYEGRRGSSRWRESLPRENFCIKYEL